MHHFVVYLICILSPLLSVIVLKKMKTSPNEQAKYYVYGTMIIAYSLILWFTLRTRSIVDLVRPPAASFPGWIMVIGFAYGAYLLLAESIEVWAIHNRPDYRDRIRGHFESRSYIEPTNKAQRYLSYGFYLFVAAGEEVFFRSYLLRYLMEEPYSLSWVYASLIAVVVFGVGHAHFRLSGIGYSTINGLFYLFLFMWSGSILLPIVVHYLYDIKSSYMGSVLRKNSLLT